MNIELKPLKLRPPTLVETGIAMVVISVWIHGHFDSALIVLGALLLGVALFKKITEI